MIEIKFPYWRDAEMTEREKIHLKACDFANKCREEIDENRKKLGEKPLTTFEIQATWLNHYDGFLAGYKDALENKE